MVTPAIGSKVSVAPQSGKIGDQSYVDTAFNFYQELLSRAVIGTQQDVQPYMLQLGGQGVIPGVSKNGPIGVGQIESYPFLEGQMIGWLMYGLLGAVTTTADSPEVGVNRHKFHYAADGFSLPYLAVRREVPNPVPANKFGETLVDAKVGSLSVTIPAVGPLGLTWSLLARMMSFERGATWAYANTVSEVRSVPNAGKGTVKIGGIEYPLNAMQIDIGNNLTDPRQVRVIGKYYMVDIQKLSGACQVRVSLLWEDSGLYQIINTGSFNGTMWSTIPWVVDTVGQVRSLYARFETPEVIDGQAVPYALIFEANRMDWQVDGPPEMRPGNLVTLTLVGRVIDSTNLGLDYVDVTVQNQITGYVLPVAPVMGLVANVAWADADNAKIMDATATVTDADSANMIGGFLIAEFLEVEDVNETTDILLIKNEGTTSGLIANVANVLKFGNVIFGTVEGGTAGAPLVCKFTTSTATPACIQALLRNLQFDSSAGTAGLGVRTVMVSIGDGDGGFATDQITVTI